MAEMFALGPDSGALVAHALPRGALIAERYVVEEKIADGTVASVYRARDERGGGLVALKVFDPLRSADAVARRRFEREYEILSSLRHAGIARALDLLPGTDFDVLVMELVEGERLSDRIGRGPLEVDEATRIAVGIAGALDVCHRAGIIHRDLKPSNVVLHPERGPVILDFGVAWLSSAMTLTQTGAIVGSPRYLAPETFASSDVDERVDIYALGTILYEAITGTPVREADTVVEMMSAPESIEPPSIRAVAPHVSALVDRVVSKALAPRPEDRFATAAELIKALSGASFESGRPLARNLSCNQCGTPLVVDLPICPGCGAATEWALEPGPYSVQILEVDDADRAAGLLSLRYTNALRLDRALLQRRLEAVPAPLAVGVSSRTAEALAQAARASGCRVEIVRGRRLLGPALRLPSWSAGQILRAMGMHFVLVMLLGTVAILAGLTEGLITALPFVVAGAGLTAAVAWARVPLLSIERHSRRSYVHPAVAKLGARLRAIESPRARRLAAGAIARAAPLLLGDDAGLESVETDALAALEDALDAAETLDTHAKVLETRPRARLRQLAARIDPDREPERHAEVEAAQREIGELAVAHDLAARRALEATEAISAVLSTRAR